MRALTPRARVLGLTAAAALAAAGAVVGVTLATTSGERRTAPAPKPRPGRPPLVADATAPPAARAGVAEALAGWPNGTVEHLRTLAARYPDSAFVRLELGLALYWNRRGSEAAAAWRAAARVEPDSPSAVRAGDILHPNMAPGLPVFVPGFQPPAELGRLPPSRQLAYLAQHARRGGARDKLLYGIALQRLGRPVSAERVFAAAAAAAPDDPEALVAAAVGRFDKDDPARAFSRLGPLTRRFPHAPTVRFHLGLLLLWIGDVKDARVQLRRVAAEAPRATLGREAKRFLGRLAGRRTH
jgi:Flp pilus assembly protein TadD